MPTPPAPCPFLRARFDLIFCMDAFHYFGAEPGFLTHLASYLKPGGQICVVNPCFDREIAPPPPPAYAAPWEDEYSRYHSPDWWRRLFEDTGLFEAVEATEPEDGMALWDDELLHFIRTGGRSRADRDRDVALDAREILHGREHPREPRVTHFILTAVKRGEPGQACGGES